MNDLINRLRNGYLTVSGEASQINAVLALHREAADEIDRLRAVIQKHATLAEIIATTNNIAVMTDTARQLVTSVMSVNSTPETD